MSAQLNLPKKPQGFIQQARAQLTKASINTVLQTTIGGQDFVDTWKANMLHAAINTAAATAANQIGEAYKGEVLNYVTHKLAHGALGAGMGALLSDDRTKGAITGAIAGVIGEMIGEYEADQLEQQAQGRDITETEFCAKQDEAVLKAKLVTSLTACLSHQDVALASRVAENAVLNNSFLIKPLLKKIFKESVKKTGKEAIKKTSKETTKKTGKEAVREAGKQEVKDAAREAGKQEAKESAKNVVSTLKMKKSLSSEQQMNEVGKIIAGPGSDKKLEVVDTLIKKYGGYTEDWVKKSSSAYRASDGFKVETHWYENLKTSQKFELKTKL